VHKKISLDLYVTVLAGHLGTAPGDYGYLDGMGTNALFNSPTDCTIDTNGNVYVVDSRNFVIRKISAAGAVTTLAGNGQSVYIDATGTNAGFTGPIGIAMDSAGNIYVSDLDSNGNRIRKITPDGVVSTLAGGPYNYEDSDGVGTNAQFVYPNGLAVDTAGTVYVADEHSIRKITPDGTVTT
jgi:sugar lactone lactonase YvrE